ncbi:hypothetical protein [Furfurilactobacillus entadae]|uniref:hypothetical protein n=1 Tax=Furfurilactobacillus entadae TaxID=2922307 RepID=UPI0035E75DE5
MIERKMRPVEHERCRTAYFNFLADGLKDHGGDMWRTIIWANNILIKLDVGHARGESYYLIKSKKGLSVAEKNKIMYELLLMGGASDETTSELK